MARQWQTPLGPFGAYYGGGIVNEDGTEEYQTPGGGILNEDQSAANFTPDVNAFRFYDSDGGEAASTALENQDTNTSVDTSGGNVDLQLRLRVDETGGAAGASTDDYQLQYLHTSGEAGSWTNITGATSTVQGTTAGLTNDAATTNRASSGISDPGAGSFVAGEQSSDGLVDDMQLTANNFTEHVWGLRVVAADVTSGDTLDFRLSTPTGMVNSVTPRITIAGGIIPQFYHHRHHNKAG